MIILVFGRASSIGFTAALKSIFGLWRHCEAFFRPNPALSCPQTLDLELEMWSKLCCKLLGWSRVATKPA